MAFGKSEDEMVFGKNLSDVKSASKAAITKLGWKIKNERGNTLECSKGLNLLSVGANIIISFSNAGGKTKISISSKDKLGMLGSVGGHIQQKKNVKKFFDEVTKRLATL